MINCVTELVNIWKFYTSRTASFFAFSFSLCEVLVNFFVCLESLKRKQKSKRRRKNQFLLITTWTPFSIGSLTTDTNSSSSTYCAIFVILVSWSAAPPWKIHSGDIESMALFPSCRNIVFSRTAASLQPMRDVLTEELCWYCSQLDSTTHRRLQPGVFVLPSPDRSAVD